MIDTQILSATEASRSFSELLHRVCYGGESFVIKKGQRLMARVVPVAETNADAKQTEEILQTDALPAGILDALESAIESRTQPVTSDEAEFYRAWMEQVRKVEA